MIKNRLLGYVNTHRRVYYFSSFLLCLGLIGGVVFSAFLSQLRQQEIESFVQDFCRTSVNGELNSVQLFINSLLHNLKVAVILWLCSVSSIFLPVASVVLLSEGFSVGFTVGSLTRIFGIRGFVLSFAAIFPGGIFAFPIIIHLGCCSIYYVLEKRRRPELASDRRIMLRFSVAASVCVAILVLSSLIDGYISPVFVRSISALF